MTMAKTNHLESASGGASLSNPRKGNTNKVKYGIPMSVRVPKSWYDAINGLVTQGLYENKNDFLKLLILRELVQAGLLDEQQA